MSSLDINVYYKVDNGYTAIAYIAGIETSIAVRYCLDIFLITSATRRAVRSTLKGGRT